MPKKPTTLLEHLEQNVKRILKTKTILKTTLISVTPTASALCFDVAIEGIAKFRNQEYDWSLLFTAQRDSLCDIVYIAPRLVFNSTFNFSASSGKSKTKAREMFNSQTYRAEKRHREEADVLEKMRCYAAEHSVAVHNAVYLIGEVIKPK